MIPRHIMLFRVAEWSFLLAISLLIIRNNDYPWPIKRASDILILFATLATAAFIMRTRSLHVLRTQQFRAVFWGMALCCAGIMLGWLMTFIASDTPMTFTQDLLAAGRYIEVFLMVCLVGVFATVDERFHSKALVAQLSTIGYLIIFVLPGDHFPDMYRFQLFENWPSNVGYYLIVSISTIAALTLRSLAHPRATLVPLGAALAGMFGILLWTASRASWLGALVGSILLIAGWFYKISRENVRSRLGMLVCVIVLLAAMASIGYLILPAYAQNNILARAFPSILHTFSGFDYRDTDPIAVAKMIVADRPPSALMQDTHRLTLWNISAQRFFDRPFGYGPNYPPIDIGAGPQGPHNTPLEILAAGGVLALFGIGLLLVHAFRAGATFLASTDFDPWLAATFAALAGLIIAAFFDNMATFRTLWLLLALGIFAKPRNVVTN